MQLGRKLAEGYAIDISDEPELSPEMPAGTPAAAVTSSSVALPADVPAVPVQV